MIFRHVLEQHADLLSFLWNARSALARNAETCLGDLLRFDLRLHGNQDGLMLAGAEAVPIAQRAWSDDDPGACFGRALLALAAGDRQALVAFAGAEIARAPLVSACGFAPRGHARDALLFLAAHPDAPMRAVAARGLRAVRLCNQLGPLIADADPSVHCPSMQASGFTRCIDVVPQLQAAARTGERFLACWALWMITGMKSAFRAMLAAPVFDARMVMLAARLAPTEWLADGIAVARRNEGSQALAISLAGSLGVPRNMGWVADLLSAPTHARLAADVLRIVLSAPNFLTENPGDPCAAFAAWSAAHAGRFQRDERYLEGAQITAANTLAQLRTGRQGIRLHAAFEAARDASNAPILNIRSPAYDQLFAMGARLRELRAS